MGKIIIFKISNWVLHVFVLGIVIEDENKVKIKNKKSCISIITDLPLVLRVSQLSFYNIGSGS